MKHSPIALGFAAFTAMTVMTGCNPESGRLDPNATENLEKARCMDDRKLNVEEVNKNRMEKLADKKDAKVRVHMMDVETGQLLKSSTHFDIAALYGAKAFKATTAAGEVIHLDLNCENMTAQLKLPMSVANNDIKEAVVEGQVSSVDTHKIEIEAEDGTYTVETDGIDALTNAVDIQSEDGINQVKVTVVKNNGTKMTIVSEAVKTLDDDLVVKNEDGDVVMKATAAELQSVQLDVADNQE